MSPLQVLDAWIVIALNFSLTLPSQCGLHFQEEAPSSSPPHVSQNFQVSNDRNPTRTDLGQERDLLERYCDISHNRPPFTLPMKAVCSEPHRGLEYHGVPLHAAFTPPGDWLLTCLGTPELHILSFTTRRRKITLFPFLTVCGRTD